MPVRSLNSSVLKWPDDKSVIFALKEWVKWVGDSGNCSAQ
jgi:hypothetical protein